MGTLKMNLEANQAAEAGNSVAPSAGVKKSRRCYKSLISEAIRSMRHRSGSDRKQITNHIAEKVKLSPAGKTLITTIARMLKDDLLIKNVTAKGTLLKLNKNPVVAPSAGCRRRKKRRRSCRRKKKRRRSCRRKKKRRHSCKRKRKRRRSCRRKKKKRRCGKRRRRRRRR